MYTGIVEGVGVVDDVTEAGEGRRIVVEADGLLDDLAVGDSVAISGVCLTAEAVGDGRIECFAAAETLERSWFADLAPGDAVNLERPLRPADPMGGHVVEGHVEASVEIRAIEELDAGRNLTFEQPDEAAGYVVEKGYVAVEGMSLTVTEIDEGTFSVTVIPETWRISNLSEKAVGDEVNVETDVLARYVERVANAA